MPGQVSSRVKQERYDRLMRLQTPISRAINRGWEGRTLHVLVDEAKDGWIAGRSFRDAPEIDGWVYAQGSATPGSLVRVTVTQGEDHDLYGVLEGATPMPARRNLVPLSMAGPRAPQ
jgi:ribosomal protein S12 methylthiotransferase